MTSAKVQVSVNGGGNVSGAVTAAFGATLQFSAVDTTGWTAAIWELVDYPPGMACPAGWSTVPGTGVYYYQPTNPTTPPPVVNVPASGALNWGKLPMRLRVNNNPTQLQANGQPSLGYVPGLTDVGTVISVKSPNLALEGVGATETSQWDVLRQWIGSLMRSLRLLDAIAAGGSVAWLSGQRVSAAGTITAVNASMTFVDASGGTCTVNPPGLAGNVYWGVCDGKKGGSFNGAHFASIPNAGNNIEDPDNPGVYTTNPIHMDQPNQSAIWMADPTNTFFKLVG